MSVVLCLPAHLCVSPQRPVAGPPRERVTHTVCCVACAVSWATWLLFAVCPLGALCCLCGVLVHLAPVCRCAPSLRCFACAVSWATWLLSTGVLALCVVLRVPCPGPLGSCSPVCPLSVLCCVCRVPGHLPPSHRCARLVCCVACAVSWATWLLLTSVPAWCIVLRVRRPGRIRSYSPLYLLPCVVLRVQCPGPPGSCSPMCPLGALCCVCGVLGHLDPVHQCARPSRCVAPALSWATWILFTGVPTRCIVLRVRRPGPLGS